MSYTDGWAALNLDMPGRVPRTEFSADGHWELVSAVTGLNVDYTSDPEVRGDAARRFIKLWNYDFIWNTLIGNQIFGDVQTRMGHANYAAENLVADQRIPNKIIIP